MERICNKCGETKPIEAFQKRNDYQSGNLHYRFQCKLCCKIITKQHRELIKDKITKYGKEYWNKNKELMKQKHKLYYESHKNRVLLINKHYKNENKERYNLLKKQHYILNKEEILNKQKLYRNRGEVKERIKKYIEKNKDHIKIRTHEYHKRYYEKNKELIKNKVHDYCIANRDKVLQNKRAYWQKNKELLNKKAKEYRENNWGYFLIKQRKDHKRDADIILQRSRKRYVEIGKDKLKRDVANLTDDYIVSDIKIITGIPRNIIRQHPELIESYRQQIKLRRLIKTMKHENIKTS